MPYLRLSSLPLSEESKRHLADELSAAILDIMPDQRPEWTTVHFTSFEPTDFAVAGRLVADGATPDVHLEISAPTVDERAWRALRNRLTDVIVEELAIESADRWHVNVKLNDYDPHRFAVAGNASDEIAPAEPLELEPQAPGGWRRPALLLGFAIGAVAGYRWFAHRVANEATVDAAPPLEGTSGTVQTAGEDVRDAISAAPTSEP